MKARVAGVAGSVLALTVIGGFAAASTFQTAPATVVQVATVEPTVAPTVAPVVVPTTAAPAPVESTVAPAPVVAPKPEVVVPKAAAPKAAPVAPKPIIQTDGNDPAFIGRYANGDPVKRDANGNVIPLPRTKAGRGSVQEPTP